MFEWLSDIWQKIENNLLIKRFNYCGINSQNELNKVLHKIHYADQRLGELRLILKQMKGPIIVLN